MERGERKRPELDRKSEGGEEIAEFRVYSGHVTCDSMQGLTHSARGADGPTQQYL